MTTGVNEILGLEELILKSKIRHSTVKCISQTAKAYLIKMNDYQRLQAQGCFDSKRLKEVITQRTLSMQRLNVVKNQYVENEKDAVGRSSIHSLSEVIKDKEPPMIERISS